MAERRRERRQALLEAGLDLFGTKGYASTSVEEICRTAYVSTRNFYEEFENREAVLWALGDQIIGEAYHAMLAVPFELTPDHVLTVAQQRRRTSARAGALLHALLDDPRRARICFIESLGVSPEQESRRRHALRLFANHFGKALGVDFAEARPEDRRTEVFALALAGSVYEVLADWVLRPDKESIDELTESIVDLILMMRRALQG